MNTPTNDVIPQGYKMTKLGALPEEWEVVKAKNYFLEIKQKVGFENKDKYKPVAVGELGLRFREEIYKHKTKLTEKTETYLIFPYCSICFGLGSKTLAVDVNTIKNSMYSVSAAYKIFKFDDNTFNPIFLGFYVKSVKDLWGSKLLVQSVRQGKKIDKNIFYNLSIPLPPLAEQQKIAAVLSAVQEAKEKTEAVIAATKALKKSMMKHLFTYGPVSPLEAENVPLKETEIGPVPEEWEVARLGEIGEFQYGYTETASSKKIGPKFLRITDIDLTGSKIKWADVPYCKISDKDYLKYKLYDEDILFTRIGATTGKTCIVKSPPESVFASYLIRFKVDLEKALPFFIYHFTTNKGYWNQINASKEGKLKKGVSSSQLKIFKLPLPPLRIQQKIASILSAIDAKIEAEENKKKALEELFKSLLHNLMTANIRVNQLEISS